uniref:Large ribosomal subunit protein bL21m n=1 Tax=Meloidogyne javanica TaxID=6303 RepID=A0A915N3Y5_MELJA
MNKSADLNFKSCSFCPTDKLEKDLYKCPKCHKFYCSVRCYRSKKHLECSELFFKMQCEELSENSAEEKSTSSISRPLTTFEQYMDEQNREKSELDEKLINPEIPLEISPDEQLLFDSDDEPEYLSDVVESSMRQFETIDDEELDRNLLAAGLPIVLEKGSEEETQEQLEKLYKSLDDDEKKKFTQMAEGLPFLCKKLARHAMTSTASKRAIPSKDSQSRKVIEPEAYMVKEKRDFVVQNIKRVVSDQTRKLFAVIYIQNVKQFKVMQDDLIHIESNIPVDVGDEIKFEKILSVGGLDFSLFGRPLLDPKFVHVHATVIEKTTTSPEIIYNFNTMYIHNPLWLSQELNVIRINNINVEEAAFEME